MLSQRLMGWGYMRLCCHLVGSGSLIELKTKCHCELSMHMKFNQTSLNNVDEVSFSEYQDTQRPIKVLTNLNQKVLKFFSFSLMTYEIIILIWKCQ